MLSTIAASVVALLTQILPLIGSSTSGIASAISLLINLIPALTNELVGLIPEVKNIIAALQQTTAVTSDQITQLQTLDAQCDANFEAAATAAGDPATSATS
jgi:hypothetical protein